MRHLDISTQDDAPGRNTSSAAADSTPTADPATIYAERRVQFLAQRDLYQRRSDANGSRNVFLFFAAVAFLIVGGIVGIIWLLILGVLLAIALVVSFIQHGKINQILQRYRNLVAITDEGLQRLARDWQNLPLRQPPVPETSHPYANDLDLVGHASLQHLLSATTTPTGQRRLQEWLLHPAAPTVARQRQGAVAELAPEIDLRDELALRGRAIKTTWQEYQQFLEWAESRPWLTPQSALVWLTRILPALAILFLLAEISGLLPFPVWLLILGVNWLLSGSLGKEVERLLDQVSERQSVFLPYAEMLHLLESQQFSAPALQAVQHQFAQGTLSASAQFTRLSRIMRYADIRLSMFAPALQIFFLWNFHTLWALERWQTTAGPRVREWLDILSEMEALHALATLAFDNPDWAFPTLTERDAPAILTASNLGHPLLPPAICVGNDVRIGPPGKFLLVTGSNMSGKSTLLRAVGVNIVLAQMGAPVCASAMTVPPIALATSIRVQDSLEQGISYYMAELRRLKSVVDAAEQTRAEGERTLFFLLDEILHGTNTSERQIAARRIIRHLLALGATGAVSTHDLTLADTPLFAGISTPVHFTEDFTRGPDGPVMTFDYTLRPGVATSTNALKLMEIVGLPLTDDDPPNT